MPGRDVCRHTYKVHVGLFVKWTLKCSNLNENCSGSTVLVKMSKINVIKLLLFFSCYIHAASNFIMCSAIQGCECAYSGTLGQLACACMHTHTHTHTHTTIAIIQCYSNTKEFLNNSSEKHWSLYNCTEH